MVNLLRWGDTRNGAGDGPRVNVVTVTPVRVNVRSQNPFPFRRDNFPPKRGPFALSTEVEPTASTRAALYPSGRDSAGEEYILPPTGGQPSAPFSCAGGSNAPPSGVELFPPSSGVEVAPDVPPPSGVEACTAASAGVGLGAKLRAEAPEFEPRPSRASGPLSSASGGPGFGSEVEDEVDTRGNNDGLAEADQCRRAMGQDGQKNGKEPTVSGTCRSGGLVYLPIRYRDRFYGALLDTGCEHSVVGAKVLPGLVVEPGAQPLYAANGTAIPIAGMAHVEFTVSGRAASVEMCVTEAISEIILGHDWLRSSGCMWDFRRGRLVYGYVQIPPPFSVVWTFKLIISRPY